MANDNDGDLGYFDFKELSEYAKEMAGITGVGYRDCMFLVLLNKISEQIEFIVDNIGDLKSIKGQ